MAHVLIVDDERSLRLTLAEFLRQDGHRVQTAEDAPAALRLLETSSFDVVVSDIILPRMTGVELMQQVRAHAPDVQVIIMTGEPTLETAIEAVRAGAHDYLGKPINKPLITGAVRRAAHVKELLDEKHRLEQWLQTRTTELEAANQELDSFSYSASHDLRAPLRAIQNLASMLDEDHAAQLDAEGQRLLHLIQREGHRMAQLIDDLLAFARLGRCALQASAVDMTALAGEVFEELLAAAPSRRVAWVCAPLPGASGDPAMLRQVWTNLLANALKFTAHKADARVEVAATVSPDGVVYEVRDNGVGFDMKYAARLFGVFQRLHAQSEFEGTGVGLALVQRIVQRHGGRVWAESQPERGATFRFTLASAPPATPGSVSKGTLPLS